MTDKLSTLLLIATFVLLVLAVSFQLPNLILAALMVVLYMIIHTLVGPEGQKS
ncbi:hypothetical protein [Aerococcus kribbianus]|uniref:Uncharacterized protein n=1 Tax=Aerococcus kribbianus TaxID=2999064 RepID=A0A9X3FPB4_9LACT|nr:MULTISPECIES: hypothetical protein [unclassified Aerococcus]MCZ0717208.1 hypothetical protein [Aerococcus sp. YH-aer221]MCZ0725496.1 hypothetical protein [Aerococcus sp. YH-aer222]